MKGIYYFFLAASPNVEVDHLPCFRCLAAVVTGFACSIFSHFISWSSIDI
jgi:hypothetical protein